jgi:Domain of unknown function (DUF4160)
MPTVLRESVFSVKIYTEDHAPMHVHVRHQNREAVILLGDDFEDVSIRENRGLNAVQLRRAVTIVKEHRQFLIGEWREIYE